MNATDQDLTTYKGVKIYNLRNSSTGGNKVMIRQISVRFLADDRLPAGDRFFNETNIKRAHAMIDWLLENGSTVEDGWIVATHTDFDFCLHGSQVLNIEKYTKFMK